MAAMTREEAVRLLRSGGEAIGEFNRRRMGMLAPGNVPNMHDIMCEELNLSGEDLSGLDLRNAILIRAFFLETNFRGCDLRRTPLSASIFNGADFTGAKLQEAHFTESTLFETEFPNANLTGASLHTSTFIRSNFTEAILSDVDLHASALVKCSFHKATLDNAQVYGVSAWDLDVTEASQKDLVINLDEAAPITVDNIEMAQFIYLMLHNEKIRSVIDTVTSKVVLILGRFTEERKAVLDAIRDKLRKCDYCPVMFDFEKPSSRDTDETVGTLARMARFVIADITDPKSIPQELGSIVPNMPSLAIQPLLQKDQEPWGMYDHIKRYPWVLPVCEYADAEDLLGSLEEKVIRPAEAKVEELRAG